MRLGWMVGLVLLASIASAQRPAIDGVRAGKYPAGESKHPPLSSLAGIDAGSDVAQASTVTVSVQQISNAATFALAPLPNSGIAQGSFFAIFGTGLGPRPANCGSGFSLCIWKPYPLPTSIQGTSVNIKVGSVSTKAYLYFATDGQINAVMPSTVPIGSGSLTVTANGQTSQPVSISVVASSFGTFSADQAGAGPGDFFNIASNGGLSGGPADCQGCNSVLNPATPGQFITLFGNGLGAPVDIANEGTKAPSFPDDFRNAPHNLDIQVFVGNQPATISYAGRSQFTGEDQINFVVPSGVSGCYVPVAIFAGPPGSQIVSNFTTISVSSDGSPCSDDNIYHVSDFASELQNKGSVNIGGFQFGSNFVTAPSISSQIVNDQIDGIFGNFSTRIFEISRGFEQAPSPGGCVVLPFTGFFSGGGDPVLNPQFSLFTGLDAGAPLHISGSKGTQPVPEVSTGLYSGVVGGAPIGGGSSIPPFFRDSSFNFIPGTYTINGPGGAQVGSFSQGVDMTAPVTWTNQSTVTANPIPRGQDLNITWSGGASGSFVVINGAGSTTRNSAGPQNGEPGARFVCVAPVAAGQFTVPSYVLQALPATSGAPWSGILIVGSAGPSVKMNPTPSGLDAAYIFYRVMTGTTVTWQ